MSGEPGSKYRFSPGRQDNIPSGERQHTYGTPLTPYSPVIGRIEQRYELRARPSQTEYSPEAQATVLGLQMRLR